MNSVTWMNLRNIMPSEENQPRKAPYSFVFVPFGKWKNSRARNQIRACLGSWVDYKGAKSNLKKQDCKKIYQQVQTHHVPDGEHWPQTRKWLITAVAGSGIQVCWPQSWGRSERKPWLRVLVHSPGRTGPPLSCAAPRVAFKTLPGCSSGCWPAMGQGVLIRKWICSQNPKNRELQ